MKKTIILIPIFLLIITGVFASLNFINPTQIATYTTNTTNQSTVVGIYNDTHLIYGNVNGSLRKILLSNNADNGTLTNTTTPQSLPTNCATSTFINSNRTIILKYPDNYTVCLGDGVFHYTTTGALDLSTAYPSTTSRGYFANNTNYFFYLMQGGLVTRYTRSAVGAPALNCFSQFNTSLLNNYGEYVTSANTYTVLQDEYNQFYFKPSGSSNWYYFSNTSASTCNDIADSITQIDIDIDTQNANESRIIINNDLYQVTKEGSQLYVYTSDDVDVYSGLVCGTNSTCYKQNSLCMPNNEIYTGVNSSNYVCENVSVLGNDIYCYIDNMVYCAGGCTNSQQTNIYGVNYLQGTCSNSTTCTNECNVEGYTYSDTSTSYKRCGFYDADTCLDFSASIPCSDGEYSNNGYCYGLNTTGVTYYSLTSFTATPNLEISNSYDLNTLPPKATYTSQNNLLNVGFDYSANPTSFYITKICNYTTSALYTNNNPYNLNTTQTITIVGYNNGESRINYLGETLRVRGTDTSNNTIYEYNITYNTSHGVCLYDNSSLLGCTAVSLSDIKNIEFTVKTNRPQTAQLHSSRVIINKNNGAYEDIYTSFRLPFSTAGNFNKLELTTDNATINSVNVYNEAQPQEAWKNTTWTQYDGDGDIIYQHQCLYTNVGCTNVRSYYNNNLNEGYWNYKDWEVCVNTLGNLKVTDTPNNLTGSLTPMQKILLSFAISFVIGMITIIAGFMSPQDSERRFLIYAGTFLFFAGLIVFALLKWLPVWVIVVPAIIAGLGVSFFFIKKSQGE